MSVLTLAEAKKHLNVTSTNEDDEIQATIDAAEATIAKRVGPLSATTVTRVVTSDGGRLVLPVTPAISLTSIAAVYGGSTVDVAGLQLDLAAGVVSSYTPSAYSFSPVAYTVTYQAGRTTLPDDLLYAVKELVRHLWRTQRGPTARPGQAPGDAPAPSYLIPYAVAELLEPHMQIGFA